MADAENKVSPGVQAARTSGAWSFGSGVASSLASLFGAFLQHRWQQQAYDRQLADNLAQWNRENEYNSPAAQMARMRQAGLNPDLMYGDVSPTGASIGKSMPSMQQFENPLNGAASIMQMTGAQIANIMADSRLKDAQARNLDQGTEKLSAETQDILAKILPPEMYRSIAEGKIKVDQATADKLIADRDVAVKELDAIARDIALKDMAIDRKKWEDDKDKIIKDLQVHLAQNQVKMSDQDVEHYVEILLANLAKTRSETTLNNETANLRKSEKTDLDNKIDAKNNYNYRIGIYTVNGYGAEVLKDVFSAMTMHQESSWSERVGSGLDSDNLGLNLVAGLSYILTHLISVGVIAK